MTTDNARYVLVKRLNVAFTVFAAAVSFRHIVHAGHELGAGGESWLYPLLIDGFAYFGLLLRSPDLSKPTRVAGLVIALSMGALSLAANIYSGRNAPGLVIGGVLVVLIFGVTEVLKDWMAPAPVVVAEPEMKPVDPKRSEAARKAAATRRKNAAAKKRTNPKPRTRKPSLAQQFASVIEGEFPPEAGAATAV